VVRGASAQCCGLEDGTALYYVVPMGRKEWEILHSFFNTLFTWATVWLTPTVITLSNFLYLFSIPS
jgi:hypothetical protein